MAWVTTPAVLLLLAVAGGAHGQVITIIEGDGPFFTPSSRWRVISLSVVPYGWAIGELRLFEDTLCSKELTRRGSPSYVPLNVTASGFDAAPAARAVDGYTWTEWRAQCYQCGPEQAWLGINFSTPVSVFCMHIWQWDQTSYQTRQVALQYLHNETGDSEWRTILRGDAMKGGRWDVLRFVRCARLPHPTGSEVEVSNGGYYPSEATLQCGSGGGLILGPRTRRCDPNGVWSDWWLKCWTPIEMIIILSCALGFDIGMIALYKKLSMQGAPPPLNKKSFIAPTHKGTWTHSVIKGVGGGQRSALWQICCCFSCRVAQTWWAAGLLPFRYGVCFAQLCLPLVPLVGASFRGDIRLRLAIPGSRLLDLLQWICCGFCVAAQEAKHIDHICKKVDGDKEKMNEDAKRKIQRQLTFAAEAGGCGPLSLDPEKHADEVPRSSSLYQFAMASSRTTLSRMFSRGGTTTSAV